MANRCRCVAAVAACVRLNIVYAMISSPPPSPPSRSELFIKHTVTIPFIAIGKTLLTPWIPTLRGLSNEEAYSQSRYRLLLTGTGLVGSYALLGAASTAFALVKGDSYTAPLLITA